MTNHILLTGAGFTYNWGGWLAKELEGDLLGRLVDKPRVRTLVQNSDNFEHALEFLEQEKQRGDKDSILSFEILEKAIHESFAAMNLALANKQDMEFSGGSNLRVHRFLSKFDAIFTLNQDLLLELHYHPSLLDDSKWEGFYLPGLTLGSKPSINKQDIIQFSRIVGQITHKNNYQPIFKLHGSIDWVDDSGSLFVIGGGKESYIRRKPILSKYFDEFRDYLLLPDTRLMIVGYGFGDEHVNKVLISASEKNSSLVFFHVHPDGRDAVLRGAKTRMPIYSTPTIANLPCIGESRRPLSSTFLDDSLEYEKLTRFFI